MKYATRAQVGGRADEEHNRLVLCFLAEASRCDEIGGGSGFLYHPAGFDYSPDGTVRLDHHPVDTVRPLPPAGWLTGAMMLAHLQEAP